MQIFVRFAYGKVITVDVSKRSTTVNEVRKYVANKLNLTVGFKFKLLFGKIELKEGEILCKENRVKKNDIIDFVELEEKVLDIFIKYQGKVKEDKKGLWKECNITTLYGSNKLKDLKEQVKAASKIDLPKQRLFFSNIELEDENATLSSYGITRYPVLECLYSPRDCSKLSPGDAAKIKEENLINSDKLVQLLEASKHYITCIERNVTLYNMRIVGIPNPPIVIDHTMKVRLLKKIAFNQIIDLNNPEIKPDELNQLEVKISMCIGATLIEDNNISVEDLITSNKFTLNGTDLSPEVTFKRV